MSMKYIPALDSYVSGSQKGAVSVWSNKVKEATNFLQVDFVYNFFCCIFVYVSRC